MEKTIKIKPIMVSLSDVILNSISIDYTNQTANISISILNPEEQIYTNRFIILTQEEYDGWGNDDNYIVDLLLSKLGLEKA